MDTTVRPFLMFEGEAEEAMNFYVSTIPGSTIGEVIRYGAGGPGAEGSIMKAAFTVGGQTVMCTDSVMNTPSPLRPHSLSSWIAIPRKIFAVSPQLCRKAVRR